MLILADEINKLISKAGNEITNRGKKYFEQDRVRIEYFNYKSDKDFTAKSLVQGTYVYEVKVEKVNGELKYSCECPSYVPEHALCKHIIAMLFDMYINPDKYMSFTKKIEKVSFNQEIVINKAYKENVNDKIQNDNIVSYYEDIEYDSNLYSGQITLIPKLEIVGIRGNTLEVSFKISSNKAYILRDLFKFGNEVHSKEIVKYGKDLEFKHTIEAFNEESKPFAEFIVKKTLEYEEFTKLDAYFTINKKYKSALKLKYAAFDEFFNIVKDHSIQIEGYDYEKCYGKITFVEQDPILDFTIQDNNKKGIAATKDVENYYIYEGSETSYILYKDKLYKCSKEYNNKIIPLLSEFNKKRIETLNISTSQATSFCEYVVPHLRKYCNLEIEERILQKYKAEKLGTKIFLDIDEKNNIVAEVKFCYGNYEFNPFNIEEDVKCNRNTIAEAKVKEILEKYKFDINLKKHIIYLSNEEDIYEFLNDGINVFMQKFEVLVTDKLKNKQVINPRIISMGVRITNNFLEINIDDLGLSESELKGIFKTYKLKKKFYRLKDGSFLNIDSSGMDTLVNISDNLGVTEKEICNGNLLVPKYRAVYLNSIIKQNNDIKIEKDQSFKEIVRDINTITESNITAPKEIDDILREYQKVGFSWLKTLEKFGFGGILADDMGLGKTIQIIAILLDAKRNKKKTSLVVCPSSLYINWKNEINKFAPELKVLVISGSVDERQKLIKSISKYDVVVTSYDLLKRDIDSYLDYEFNYVVADEAQYIKNNNTKNARALKRIKSQTRFALTGTPIENSLSELWSIFDFVMPGYLFGYKKFKDEIETPIIKDNDKDCIEKLQKLVAPFILRRIKKEVLKELPEKTETVMYSEMTQEQEKIYQAYLAKAKNEMKLELEENGFEKSKMKILAIITRLRQICCHPSLFIENYQGGSAKLTQCIEILEEAISAGHKILLFSGFTSMFEVIISELKERDIKYSILTGQTKVDTRVEIVDEFNTNKDINVFLVSLKAGGTGLNLTGADMVIHFDPWWNLSAQNQATDRAYRIGQRSNVQVFKLIAQNSIEEKIQILQDKKIDLTNSVIKEGETFINRMSQEEILDLFES